MTLRPRTAWAKRLGAREEVRRTEGRALRSNGNEWRKKTGAKKRRGDSEATEMAMGPRAGTRGGQASPGAARERRSGRGNEGVHRERPRGWEQGTSSGAIREHT